MPSSISTKILLETVEAHLTGSKGNQAVKYLAQRAIIDTDRQIRVDADPSFPLAWDIVPFDGMRTCAYAEISGITQASPGVITAESMDSDVTGHGFPDNSSTHQAIVIIDGVEGMEEVNGRVFLVEYVSATTFSLKTLEGVAVNTTNYTEYDSGGYIYHAGFVLNTTVVLAGVDSKWDLKEVYQVMFDGYPTDPISENEVRNEQKWLSVSSGNRPTRFRHWQHWTVAGTVAHYLLWYPVCLQRHNLMMNYVKDVSDISAWTASTYPFHPPEVHNAIWHGALANLHGEAERMKRSNDHAVVIRMEVMFAQKWVSEFRKDLMNIRQLSRRMLGITGGRTGVSA